MAKTWTLREAYEAVKANNVSAIADFGKRFPIATAALAKCGANDGLDVLMSAFPDRVTMRTLEMVLKEGVEPIEDDAEVEAPAEKPVKKEKKAEKKQTEEKAEKPVKKATKAKKAEKPVEDDAENEEAEGATDYSEMGAVDLFKLCKKRGIKVEPKQKASVYIKALEAADKAEAEADGDEDWDDNEDEKPAKKSTKKAEKPAKKADADDDDSDWDI